jgi:hypothetical protein
MDIHQIDSEKTVYPYPQLAVESCRYKNLVLLLLPDGKRYMVQADNLKAAICNATNTNPF